MGDPDEEMPPSPFSDLRASTAQLHELFMAYVDSGFTRREALRLLRDNIKNARLDQGLNPGVTAHDWLAALASLTGAGAVAKPGTPEGRAELALRLVGDARRAGVTWAAIGAAFGLAGPQLGKREARRLAHAVAAGKGFEPMEPRPSR